MLSGPAVSQMMLIARIITYHLMTVRDEIAHVLTSHGLKSQPCRFRVPLISSRGQGLNLEWSERLKEGIVVMSRGNQTIPPSKTLASNPREYASPKVHGSKYALAYLRGVDGEEMIA